MSPREKYLQVHGCDELYDVPGGESRNIRMIKYILVFGAGVIFGYVLMMVNYRMMGILR